MVVTHTGTRNGSSTPVNPQIPKLMYMANSITSISINGSDIELNTKKIIRNTSPMEIQLTTWKSLDVS